MPPKPPRSSVRKPETTSPKSSRPNPCLAVLDGASRAAAVSSNNRLHWIFLSPHLQWTVLQHCLPRRDLRQLMARFVEVFGLSDFDLQCEAARLTSRNSEAARLLQVKLEELYGAAVEQVAKADTEAGVLKIWEKALQSGDVTGAYWAIVTDSRTAPGFSRTVSREMSRLKPEVQEPEEDGLQSGNALENAELRKRVEMLLAELKQATAQRDRDAAEKGALRMQLAAIDESWRKNSALETKGAQDRESNQLRRMLVEVGRELSTLEDQFKRVTTGTATEKNPLSAWIEGRRVLYFGGRPSSNPLIRTLVEVFGGEYRRYEGHIDEQDGHLASVLDWADLVTIPLDCFDSDSVIELSRACQKRSLVCTLLRTASVASFTAGLSVQLGASRQMTRTNGLCLRNA